MLAVIVVIPVARSEGFVDMPGADKPTDDEGLALQKHTARRLAEKRLSKYPASSKGSRRPASLEGSRSMSTSVESE